MKNKLLREANATTGSAHSKWLRDKKLALETAELYTKGIITRCVIEYSGFLSTIHAVILQLSGDYLSLPNTQTFL